MKIPASLRANGAATFRRSLFAEGPGDQRGAATRAPEGYLRPLRTEDPTYT